MKATISQSKFQRVVMCDFCNKGAEYVESLPAFTSRLPKHVCEKHKPKEEPWNITYGVYLGNKTGST